MPLVCGHKSIATGLETFLVALLSPRTNNNKFNESHSVSRASIISTSTNRRTLGIRVRSSTTSDVAPWTADVHGNPIRFWCANNL